MSKVSLPQDVEKELVAKAQANSQEFAALYEHYYPHIRRFFAVKLHSEAQIEDLTSQVFEKALRNLKSFQWQGFSFSAWLYKIARNLIVDYYRSQQSGNLQLDAELQIHDAAALTLDEQVQQDFEQELVHKLLNDLKDTEREIVYAKFFKGWTNRLIAQKLGLSESNVGTILYRVLGKLRRVKQY